MATKTTNWTIAILAIALVLVVALFAIGRSDISIGGQRETITVSGNYEKEYMPDKAELYLEIKTEAKTADEAKTKNAETSKNVMDGLLTQVDKEDISTSSYYMNELIDWSSGSSVKKGYYVSNVLKVDVKDFDKIGKIIDSAIGNGATSVQTVNFGFTKDTENEYQKEVLGEAAKAAKTKAEVLAESMGFKLGKIVSIGESNYYYNPRAVYDSAVMMKGNAGQMAFEETSVTPGKMTIYATVSATYQIK